MDIKTTIILKSEYGLNDLTNDTMVLALLIVLNC